MVDASDPDTSPLTDPVDEWGHGTDKKSKSRPSGSLPDDGRRPKDLFVRQMVIHENLGVLTLTKYKGDSPVWGNCVDFNSGKGLSFRI